MVFDTRSGASLHLLSRQGLYIHNLEPLLVLRPEPHVDPHPQLPEDILRQEVAQGSVVRLRPPEHLLQDHAPAEAVVLPPAQDNEWLSLM